MQAVRDAVEVAAERAKMRWGEQQGSWVPEVTVVRRSGYGQMLRKGISLLMYAEATLLAMAVSVAR